MRPAPRNPSWKTSLIVPAATRWPLHSVSAMPYEDDDAEARRGGEMAEYIVSAVDAEETIWIVRSDDIQTAQHFADLLRVNDYTRVTVSLSGSEPD